MALSVVPRWRRWLGHSGRVEFWVSMVGLVALHPVLLMRTRSEWAIIGVPLVGWLVVATRRLNDLRGRWWWAVLPWGGFGLAAALTGVAAALAYTTLLPLMRIASLVAAAGFLIALGYLGLARPRRDTPTVDLSTFD